jgi:hypothetical protein
VREMLCGKSMPPPVKSIYYPHLHPVGAMW